MILGVGIDLVEIQRIEASLARFGERFTQRILTSAEFLYCQSFKEPHIHVAARFAAKEAIAKAFGTGIGEALGWLDMEITRRASGEPAVVLRGNAVNLLAQKGGRHILVSLTHTRSHAAAVAIIEG